MKDPREDTHINPSQLELAVCKAAWGFRYVEGIEPASAPSAAIGTAVHDHLKNYLKKGLLPPADEAGRIATAGIRWLPEPSLKLSVEEPFFVDFEGTPFRGTPDLLSVYRDIFGFGPQAQRETFTINSWPTHDEAGNAIPFVEDHKTAGSMKYAQTPESLPDNTQTVVYGYRAVSLYLDTFGFLPSSVQFMWLYYLKHKKQPKAKPIYAWMQTHEILARMRMLVPHAQELISLRRRGDVKGNELPKNTSMCCRFDGCKYGTPPATAKDQSIYLRVCHKSALEKVKAAMSGVAVPLSSIINSGLPSSAAHNPVNTGVAAFTAAQANPTVAPLGAPAGNSLPPGFGGVPAGPITPVAPLAPQGMPNGLPPGFGGAPVAMAAPQAPVIDPRIAELPAEMQVQGQRFCEQALAYFDANDFDHRTMQKRVAAPPPPAPAPVAAAPSFNPAAFMAQQAQQAQQQAPAVPPVPDPRMAYAAPPAPAANPAPPPTAPAQLIGTAQNGCQIIMQSGQTSYYGTLANGQQGQSLNYADLVGPPMNPLPSAATKVKGKRGRKTADEQSESDSVEVTMDVGFIRAQIKLWTSLLPD